MKVPSIRRLSFLPFLIIPCLLAAQDNSPDPDDDEVVTLAEFEVKSVSLKDDYIVTEAVAGTRFAESIIDLPYSIDVITDQLIEDFQLFEDEDLLEFIGGASGDPSDSDLDSGTFGGTVRGFKPLVLRDGFQLAVPANLANTRQATFIKGPASTLYGRAEPGGFINKETRRPSTRPRLNIYATYGDDEYIRVGARASGPLAKKTFGKKLYYLAYLNYIRQKGSSYGPVDYAKSENFYAGATLLYKFRSDSSLSLTAEYHPNRAVPYLNGIARVYDARRPGRLQSGSITVTRGWRGQDSINPRYSPDAYSDTDTFGVNLLFEHRLNRTFNARAALHAFTRDSDRAYWSGANDLRLYDDTPDPSDPSGYLYNGTFTTRTPVIYDISTDAAAFQIELTGEIKRQRSSHRFLLALDGSLSTQDKNQKTFLAFDDPTAISSGNIVKLHQDGSLSSNFYNSPLPSSSHPGYYESVNTTLDEKTLGAFGSYRGKFLRNHLALMASFRFDAFDDTLEDKRNVAYDNDTETFMPVPDPKKGGRDGSKLTYSLGANYYLVGEKLVFYASTSTSYRPKNTIDSGFNTVVPPEESSAFEFGLKGYSSDDTFGYTFSFYTMDKENVAVLNEDYHDTLHANQHTEPQYIISGKQRSRGADARFSWRPPVRGLVFITSFGYCDNEVLNGRDNRVFVVGKPAAGVSKWNAAFITRYNFHGALKGLKTGAAASWKSDSVGYYPTTDSSGYPSEYGVDFPSVFRLSLFARYEFKLGKNAHNIALNIKNALDKDIYARIGRPYYGRVIRLTYGVRF